MVTPPTTNVAASIAAIVRVVIVVLFIPYSQYNAIYMFDLANSCCQGNIELLLSREHSAS